MKSKQWVNGNKMLFESEHKTFNRQTNCISTGNVIANTQHSGYVRAHSCVECNGFIREKGHLRRFDLDQFSYALGHGARRWLDENKEKTCIVYIWKHYNAGKRIIDGITITDTDHKLLKSFVFGSYKTYSAVKEAEAYITNQQ